MRIKCQSVEDFIENLRDVSVHEKTVFVDCSHQPLNEENLVFDVFLHATAVIEHHVDGEVYSQALVQYGENCGRDRRTADSSDEGTVVSGNLINVIKDFCGRHGLTVKPGILDI